MVERIKDSQGNYILTNHDDLKAFVENAVQDRVDQLAEEDQHRSLRFKGDAETLRAVYKQHQANKPDLTGGGKSSEIRQWNERLLELERGAQTAERQHTIHLKSMQNPNMDLLKRQARRHVSEQEPELYALYQQSRKTQRVEQLLADLDTVSGKLNALIKDNAPTRHVNTSAKKLDGLVKSLEKSDVFLEKGTHDQKTKLQTCKAMAEKQLRSIGRDRGLGRE